MNLEQLKPDQVFHYLNSLYVVIGESDDKILTRSLITGDNFSMFPSTRVDVIYGYNHG